MFLGGKGGSPPKDKNCEKYPPPPHPLKPPTELVPLFSDFGGREGGVGDLGGGGGGDPLNRGPGKPSFFEGFLDAVMMRMNNRTKHRTYPR